MEGAMEDEEQDEPSQEEIAAAHMGDEGDHH